MIGGSFYLWLLLTSELVGLYPIVAVAAVVLTMLGVMTHSMDYGLTRIKFLVLLVTDHS